MPTRQKTSAGMVRSHHAGSIPSGLRALTACRRWALHRWLLSSLLRSSVLLRAFPSPLRSPLCSPLRSPLLRLRRPLLPSFLSSCLRRSMPGAALAVLLAGCATLTESTEQYVMVQTVLDHQQVAGVGCVLSNDSGRWFVTSPGRVRIRKSTQPLAVDCRLNDVYVYDQVSPKQNSSRWGNILLTAGTGQFVDRQTGAGFDYPGTLTVLLKRVAPAPAAPAPAPAPPAPPPPPKPQEPPQPPGGSAIY